MTPDATAVFGIAVIILIFAGAMFTLASHVFFLYCLRAAHPGLWAIYREIAFTGAHWTLKHPQLCAQVYPFITDPTAQRARRIDLLMLRIFAFSAFGSAAAFAAWCLIPLLRQ